jgi:membrane associated rhomboid family serine protease
MNSNPADTPKRTAFEQREHDRMRLKRAFYVSVALVVLLLVVFLLQGQFDWRAFAVYPRSASGLIGIVTAPLLHGSWEHLAANSVAILVLGTLAGSVYPRATARGLPIIWLGSGIGAWWWGYPGTFHLGASGLTHGLMFLVFVLGVLKRDKPAMAAGMIAIFFYGSMLLTILAREPGVSWQSHLGGSIAGILAAFLFRHLDDRLPQ